MTAIRINHAERKIILSSAFEKKASIPGTNEYLQLQTTRNDNLGYALVTRKFKANTAQEHYRGLTYDYMREYISTHEADAAPILAELEEMIGISKAHSLGKRYPTIKAWFLDRYPAFAQFGMTEVQVQEYRDSKKVVDLREGGSSAASAESADPLDKVS